MTNNCFFLIGIFCFYKVYVIFSFISSINFCLHQSCYELFSILNHKEDAEQVIEQWTNHERWCVRALTQGAEHLLVAGSFNNSLDDSEDDSDSDGDDLDSFVDWADSVA